MGAMLSRASRWMLPQSVPPEHAPGPSLQQAPIGPGQLVQQPGQGMTGLSSSQVRVVHAIPGQPGLPRAAGCFCLSAPRVSIMTKYLSALRPPELALGRRNALTLLNGMPFGTMFSCSSSEVSTLKDRLMCSDLFHALLSCTAE